MYTKIAHTPPPRTGSPKIHAPGVYGASTGKPILWRIPTTGARPFTFAINGLPDGLTLDAENGILSGKIERDGEYTLQIRLGSVRYRKRQADEGCAGGYRTGFRVLRDRIR